MRRALTVALIVLPLLLMASPASLAAQHPVGLGTADSFAVLAGETITNTGPTTITGDVGLHPGSSVTGFEPADPQGTVTMSGELHIADDVAAQAKADLVTAYDDAAGRTPTAIVGTELGGQTLVPGVYRSESGEFGITGTLTLNAQGNPDAVFIFQTASTLITAPNSRVELINGADACNVFWQVGSSATLDTGTSFKGNILALTSITLNNAAVITDGRALARNGAVTMDTNTITRAACETPGDGTPDDGTDDGTTDDGTTDDGTTDDGTTDDGTTDDGTPGSGTPGDGTPGDGTPGDGTPGDGTPGTIAPPVGGVATGDGSTAAFRNGGLLAVGCALVLSALVLLVVRPPLSGKPRR